MDAFDLAKSITEGKTEKPRKQKKKQKTTDVVIKAWKSTTNEITRNLVESMESIIMSMVYILVVGCYRR